MAAADLAAWLVERRYGQAGAQKSLRIMLIDHARHGSASQPQKTLYEHVQDNRVRHAIHLIEQHLAEPLISSALARRLNVSRRQLERCFQDELNTGPQQLSRQLLLHYDRSITAIAAECGFADTAHFSRQFKTLHGQTPSAMRAAQPPIETRYHRIAPANRADDLFERGSV